MIFTVILQYSIIVEGHDQFCFTQTTKQNSELSISFYAVEGGDMTITSTIVQANKQLDKKEDVPSGNFYVNSTVDGIYNVCFHNNEGHQKQITFFVQITERTQEKQELDQLNDQLVQIQRKMSEVHQFQRQSQQIEHRLQTVMDQIKASVTTWTVVKFVAILGCATYQIWTFKKFFSKKKTAV